MQMAEPLIFNEDMSEEAALRALRPSCSPGRHPRARSARLDAYPHQWSGGMLQRAVIAMAIAGTPEAADRRRADDRARRHHPGADPALLVELRRELRHGAGAGSHDMGVVAETSDRVAVMYAGRIVEPAPTEALFARPVHPYSQGLLRLDPAARAPAERRCRRSPACRPTWRGRGRWLPVRPRCAVAIARMPARRRLARWPRPCSPRAVPGRAAQLAPAVKSGARSGRAGDRRARRRASPAALAGILAVARRPPVVRAVDGVSLAIPKGETLAWSARAAAARRRRPALLGLRRPPAGTSAYIGRDLAAHPAPAEPVAGRPDGVPGSLRRPQSRA